MEEHEKGREAFGSEEEYRLHCLRHSTAHVMAQAVMRLWPEARLAIGPAIRDGFYYDIDLPETVSEDDLARIEREMKRIVKENQPFVREEWDRDEARRFFEERGQRYKVELIDGIADERVTIYRNPAKKGDREDFVDLCAGPHVLRTGQCKHFKLLRVSGAYWRGDANNPQLQRIYGTVWPKREELDAYLHRLEEARKRDHRRLGRELGLFMFHDFAPGSVFWLPAGEHLYHLLSERMRELLLREGYQVVRTPLVYDKRLWEISGHWEHYRDDMFWFPESHDDGGDGEGRVLALKPMNCPSHMLIFKSRRRSYRDLPLRIHDQGSLHRNELSGALSGLTRVRHFRQDDAHIFCAEEQVGEEVARLLDLLERVYSAFDLRYRVVFSTRPEERMGDDELWDRAEAALRDALDASGLDYRLAPGDGAFYGPKIDIHLVDALEREHQCATIQADFLLPRRFELSYVGEDNRPHVPVVLHRAIFGSFERFIAILVEHYAGRFPVWLAPEAVCVMTVSEKSLEHGRHVHEALERAGIRATFDDSDAKIGYKIRAAHGRLVPYMAIVGEREQAEGTVAVRARDRGDLGAMPLDDFVARLVEESRPRL